MIVRCAGIQCSIRISPEALYGTGFHSVYKGLLAETNERDEDGLPKHSILKTIDALQQLVCKTCTPVCEAYGKTEAPSKPETLQEYLQPPTIHIALTRDACGEGGVIPKVIGDLSRSYPWDTSRIAQNNNHITNTYSWDIAPVPKQELKPGSMVQTFPAIDFFVTEKTITDGPIQQVHNTAGTQFFFKPRFDLMAPEFDREVSVLGAIRSCGLDQTLKVSPFKGLVFLDNGLVAGMLFAWLEGWPLAEHPELSNPNLHKRWREQVETIVEELHRHKIVWGDVNVHNVFIDLNGDAWVIDFGGNCNVQFVDEELKETYEGDAQGLRRIFEEWLPGVGQQ